MSTLSLIPEEKKRMFPSSSKSTESLYSSSSSKYSVSGLHRRKASNRHAGFIPATNEVRQRVLSARLLRMKTLQNQLSDAQQHISELANENRILRTLHKRQDSALSKYENTNAELPQLLHSHAEEIRVWQTKCRNLQLQNKELAHKLKQKDSALLAIGDQNKHLLQLSKDKNLEDRERLADRVRYLENRLIEKDNDMKLMTRRLQLETKSFKTQLQNEHQKYKEAMAKYERVRQELNKLNQTQCDLIERSRSSLLPRSFSASKSTKNLTDINQKGFSCQHHLQAIHGDVKTAKSLTSEDSSSPKLDTLSPKGNSRKYSAPSKLDSEKRKSSGERGKNNCLDDITKVVMSQEHDGYVQYSEVEISSNGNEYVTKDRQTKLVIRNEQSDKSDKDDEDDIIAGEIRSNKYENNGHSGDEGCDDEEYELKTDFAKIRRQISEDYREKQSFLDTFCRLSTSEINEKNSKLASSRSISELSSIDTARRRNIDHQKKIELLKALKTIDADSLSVNNEEN